VKVVKPEYTGNFVENDLEVIVELGHSFLAMNANTNISTRISTNR
jgi:hypothetical protein